jgi:hypothetical protein
VRVGFRNVSCRCQRGAWQGILAVSKSSVLGGDWTSIQTVLPEFDVKPSTDSKGNTALWETGFAALCRFRAREGHCCPSRHHFEGNVPPGASVTTQRYYKDEDDLVTLIRVFVAVAHRIHHNKAGQICRGNRAQPGEATSGSDAVDGSY